MDFYSMVEKGACPLPEVLAVRRDVSEKRAVPPLEIVSKSDVLSVYLSGGPCYSLDGRTYEFSPPMAMLIPSGTLDRDLQESRVNGIFVLFDGNGLLEKCYGAEVRVNGLAGGEAAGFPLLKELLPGDAQALAAKMEEVGTIDPGDKFAGMRKSALLLEAVADFCTARGRSRGDHTHREAERLLALINMQTMTNQPMSRIYCELKLTQAHSATLFRNAYGISPVAFRTRLRMTRARELLISSQLNVSEVAFEVGYSDPLYFSRIFRKHFNVTPSSLISDFMNARMKGHPL